MVNALRFQRSGDDSNARVHLTKALKTAHAQLGNTQMVAQVRAGFLFGGGGGSRD